MPAAPRILDPARRITCVAGLLLLPGFLGALLPTAAAAQLDPLFRYHAGSEFLPSTPGTAGGAAGAFYNPASWATAGETEAVFWWNDETIRENSLDNWGFSAGRNLGFSVQSRTARVGAGTLRSQDYQIGFAGGDRRSHFGAAWRWSGGDGLDRKAGLALGTVLRPSRYLSLGLGGFLEHALDPQEGTFDLGFRPFAKPWLTLFGDYSLTSEEQWDDGDWGAGAEIRPLRGVHAGVRFRDAEGFDSFTYQFYAGVVLDRLGLFAQPRYREHGERAGTSYLLRWQPPFGNLSVPAFPVAKRPDRIVPVDLENRTLSYRKARWFDDRHVAWLDLGKRLASLEKDPSVRGVALNLSGFRAGPALQWELREKLRDLRERGKQVYVQADRLDMGGAYLAAAANRLSLDPQGDIFLPGLAVHRTYMRGLLDKMGIGVEEWRYLTHKTAFQTLSRRDMSEADREQLGRLADVVYETWRDGIAEGRGLLPAQVESVVDGAVNLTPRQAVDRGFADRVGRWTDFKEEIAKETGARIRAPKPAREGAAVPDERWGRPKEIALVYALGPCEMDSGIRGRATGKHLRSLAADRDVAAVVLRADSPGGDPLPSDLVAEGTRKVKEAGKPVVVSQGAVAASGGYWISMDGTRILTTPVTITGSIGVIAGWLWDDGLGEKTGITSEGVQRGAHADLFTGTRFPLVGLQLPRRNLTDAEKELTRGIMLDLYGDFVGKVAAARNLPESRVRELGEGRVWMGPDALDRGLVDGIGTLEDALLEARRLAGIDPEDEVVVTEYPAPAFFLRPRILSGLGALAGLLPGAPSEPPATGEPEDYPTTYFRTLGRFPGGPLLLTPVDLVPEDWERP